MKKSTRNPLTLRREHLKSLTDRLGEAVGGRWYVSLSLCGGGNGPTNNTSCFDGGCGSGARG